MDDDKTRALGRPRGRWTQTYQVKLPPDDAEWGKNAPEGLSGLLRRLLAEERQRVDAAPSLTSQDGLEPVG